jgi:hypothetical protein
MLKILKTFVPRSIKALLGDVIEWRYWLARRFSAPAPGFVKRGVLQREGAKKSIWIETGTYRGETTNFLSGFALSVISIEPDPGLFDRARKRFQFCSNIKIIQGLSEHIFPNLLPTIKGDVSFWLDGHYSGGITHRGPKDCPIVDELSSIEKNIKNFSLLAVLIDDVRCFDPSLPGFAGYPTLNYLVDWATRNALRWHIEHDIFIAKNF